MSYAWEWQGRCRTTGRVDTFYTTGPYPDRPSLRDHIEAHYQGLVFVDAAEADGPPKAVLRPVNPGYFQHGIIDQVCRELGGPRRVARAFGTVGDVRRRLLAPATPAVAALTAASPRPAGRLSAAPSRLR